MNRIDFLIEGLADEVQPVRVRRLAGGRLIFGLVAAATIVLIAAAFGLRADVIAGHAPPMLVVTAGLLALLAIAAGTGAVRMARPQVGAPPSGAGWLMATLAVIPLAAVTAIASNQSALSGLAFGSGIVCLRFGMAMGLATVVMLTLWLRQGAPASPERASLLVGVAGGAVGALGNTLECTNDAIAHLAFWHLGAVPLMAVAARIVLPRFLRW